MVNFNFSFDPGTSLQQMLGFEIAGRVWSSYLTDNTTINLQVGVSSSLGSKVIGGALPGIAASQSYQAFNAALKADAKSTDDQAAVRKLFGLGFSGNSSFSATYDFTQLGILNLTGTGTSSTLNLTRAEAKALGLPVNGGATALDGYIVFSNLAGTPVQWSYDYTRSAPAPANSLDFLSTAMHEIGHILGFVSAVDSPTWVNSILGIGTSLLSVLPSLNAATANTTPLDLFRYDTNFLNQSDNRNLSIGDTKVFAFDSFNAPIAQFATGKDTTQGGDGQQASHWKAGTNALMAPTLKTGTRSAISNLDLRAFDVLGWDLAPNGINTAINLSTLQTQAKQALATRLGQTVSWLDANATTAAQQLGQDRSLDVLLMVIRSGIYDLSRISAATSAGTSKLTYNQLFEERGLFETLDELEVVSEVSLQPTLEALVAADALPQNYTTVKASTATFKRLAAANLERVLATPASTTLSLSSKANTITIDVSSSVQTLSTVASATTAVVPVSPGQADYYYGSSKLVTYNASDKPTHEQFDPRAFFADLSAMI